MLTRESGLQMQKKLGSFKNKKNTVEREEMKILEKEG